VLQAFCKASGTRIGVLPKNLLDLRRLSAAGFGNSDQFPVGISQLLFGLLALAKRYPMELLRNAPNASVAGAEDFLAPRRLTVSTGNTFFALLSSRLMTLTPSPRRALSVG
jgi:hypothetical protein